MTEKTEKAESRNLLVYVDAGGTCRSPMAKVITEEALKSLNSEAKLEVKAAAYEDTSSSGASPEAQEAIKNLYQENLLKNFEAKVLDESLKEKADLILVMEPKFLAGLPSEKTYNLKDFVGSSGAVEDPWCEGNERYTQTAAELCKLIEGNIKKIIETATGRSN